MLEQKNDEAQEELDDLLQEEEQFGEEEATPEDSSPSNEEDDQPEESGEEDPEENLPFHKHPRWKEMQEERKQYKEEREQLKKELESIKGRTQEIDQLKEQFNKQPDELPEFYKKLWGDDETAREAYKLYKQAEEEKLASLKESVRQELEEEKRQEEARQKEAQKMIDDQYKELEESGYKFNKDELANIAIELDLYNPQTGVYNLLAANEILQARKSQSPLTEKKKGLASKTTSRASSSPKKNKTWTIKELRENRIW
jgi:hypothetical protein